MVTAHIPTPDKLSFFLRRGPDERIALWEKQPQSTLNGQGWVWPCLFIKYSVWIPDFHYVFLKKENIKLAVRHMSRQKLLN